MCKVRSTKTLISYIHHKAHILYAKALAEKFHMHWLYCLHYGHAWPLGKKTNEKSGKQIPTCFIDSAEICSKNWQW